MYVFNFSVSCLKLDWKIFSSVIQAYSVLVVVCELNWFAQTDSLDSVATLASS